MMALGLIVGLALGACTSAPGQAIEQLSTTPRFANVRDYGAAGDGVAPNRIAFQGALNAAAGGTVFVPNGTYLLEQDPRQFGSLFLNSMHSGTAIRGETRDGVVLRMAPGAGTSEQLIYLLGCADCTLENLTIEGQRAIQTVDPHRAGIFAKQSPRLRLFSVASRGFTGDGAEIYDGSDDPTVVDVELSGNGRNGLTLGGGTTGGMFTNSRFSGNDAEQFDSEGGSGGPAIDHVTITDCAFDGAGPDGALVSRDFVLTMTGTSTDTRSKGWTVTHNTVNGSALILWINDVVYSHNTGINPSNKPSVYVYRSVDDITIEGNTLAASGLDAVDTIAPAIVEVIGTNTFQCAQRVRIIGNTLSTALPQFGITGICAHNLTIENNVIYGAGVAHYDAGINLRTTRATEPMEDVRVARNQIYNFGWRGLRVGGNGNAVLGRLVISDNIFGDTGSGAMSTALDLNDGTNAARDVTAYGNTMSGGTTTLLVHPPGGIPALWGDGLRWRQ